MIVVVDYGMGNLLSVRRALEHVGATVEVSSDATVIAAAERLVLPGVGAFADGMRELDRRGLVPVLRERVEAGVPLLGVCLGMQMLFDESPEFGRTEGLGFVAGRVEPISPAPGRRVPRIGWGALDPAPRDTSWRSTILERIAPGDFVYFAHSFSVDPADLGVVVATTDYDTLVVPAVIHSDNVWGTQFHPEKSGPVGLRILSGFLTL